MSSYITSLVKFTDHTEDFINGDLYCNTWEYFDKLEKKGIGDLTEMTQVTLKTEYENRIMGLRFTIRLTYEDLCYTPVFCMYSYYSKIFQQSPIIKLPKIPSEGIGSYKSAVLITDVKEFLNRINKKQPSFCYSPIKYIYFDNQRRGKTIDKKITKKDKCNEYQQEFRIYDHSIAITRREDFDIPGIKKIPGIDGNGNLAEKFPIGNLSDIAKKYSLDELFQGVKIELNIDWEYCHKNKLVKEQRFAQK